MDENTMKVAVIGAGHLGNYHAQKYAAHPAVELLGVVDTDRTRADEIARQYGTRAFYHHRDILGRVDAVSIAVPTEHHFAVARDVISGGIHVLIEKPITYDLGHADMLLRSAREKAVIVQVGHVERFNPAVVKMESLLKAPVFIDCQRMHLFTTRGTDVDVVLDLMIHDLDIILHMVPSELKELHAVGMTVITGKTDIGNARMIFENGTVANVTASRVSNKTRRKIRVFQPGDCLSADCLRKEFSITPLRSAAAGAVNEPLITSNTMKFPDSDALADEIGSFIDAVKNGTEPVVSGRDGRMALKVALDIISQIEEGCSTFRTVC